MQVSAATLNGLGGLAYQRHRTEFRDPVGERDTAILVCTLIKPETGVAFKPADLTLTLYHEDDTTIVNSRDATDILDLNGGAVTSLGVLTLELTPSDNAIVTPVTEGRLTQRRRALLQATWSGANGDRTGSHEVVYYVESSAQVG